jgi:aminoglycoside 6-adenylyltransferase
MCSEAEMIALILRTARGDERIRAVVMNGSRSNPNAPRDFFQNYHIRYIVAETASFRDNPAI